MHCVEMQRAIARPLHDDGQSDCYDLFDHIYGLGDIRANLEEEELAESKLEILVTEVVSDFLEPSIDITPCVSPSCWITWFFWYFSFLFCRAYFVKILQLQEYCAYLQTALFRERSEHCINKELLQARSTKVLAQEAIICKLEKRNKGLLQRVEDLQKCEQRLARTIEAYKNCYGKSDLL